MQPSCQTISRAHGPADETPLGEGEEGGEEEVAVSTYFAVACPSQKQVVALLTCTIQLCKSASDPTSSVILFDLLKFGVVSSQHRY